VWIGGKMHLAVRSLAATSNGRSRGWIAVAMLEAVLAAFLIARIAFGPISAAPSRIFWLLGAAVLLLVYLCLSLWSTTSILVARKSGIGARWLLWITSIPFIACYAMENYLLQFRPDLGGWVYSWLSIIQPFPTLGMGIVLLLVFFLKMLAVSSCRTTGAARSALFHRCADVAIPAALLLIGLLQATVYLVPIANAFLRFWALGDAVGTGIPYPVTLTEEGPVNAGSPIYVYDLPLFPLMIRLAFTFFGHNSAAAHLPSVLFNALFPLSIFLLIRQATGSRVVALVFGVMASLFPFLRFWVLNLPDPDPVLMTSLCLAGYFYLRAQEAPGVTRRWVIAGIAGGVLSLVRPEGILYAGCMSLGLLAYRPRIKQYALYALCIGLLVVPMIAIWHANFGFLWPQNYNNTLRLDYPKENYDILNGYGYIGMYYRGLGLDGGWALGILALFVLSVVVGTLLIAFTPKDHRLLAMAIPGIGNTVIIFFANPYIPNTFHFADFFRHASFGIPFLVLLSAYTFHRLCGQLTGRVQRRWLAYAALILMVGVVVREGDILANPTATHRQDGSATQVLTTFTYLSMQSILQHPMPLPQMGYYKQNGVTIARSTVLAWPDDSLKFFQPLDMSFDSQGGYFGYASVAAFLLALCFALLAEGRGNSLPHPPVDTR